MKYKKEIEINIGDIVDCLTNDGWEVGEVKDLFEEEISVLTFHNWEINNYRIEQIKV